MKYLIGLLSALVVGYFALITWDNSTGDLNWLPAKMREVNVYELLPHAVLIALLGACVTFIRATRERKLIQRGIATGTFLAQRINVRRVGASGTGSYQLLLTWVDSMLLSAPQAETITGSPQSTAALVRDCDRAVQRTAEISPTITSTLSLSALYQILAHYTSLRSGHAGKLKRVIITPACEDPAQIKFTRFFELPPAMLLLFFKKTNASIFITIRSVQAYRLIALNILAEQILTPIGPLPAWSSFSSGPIFAVRDLPVQIEDGAFDWWNAKWDFDPRNPPSPEALTEKRDALLEALLNSPPVEFVDGHLVRLHPQFEKWIDTFPRESDIPRAHWY